MCYISGEIEDEKDRIKTSAKVFIGKRFENYGLVVKM